MFDISFTELLVIGAVALVVLGPEKLPKVARTVGHLVGRLQRYVSDVKRDINREMELDELRRLRAEMDAAARDVRDSMRKHTDDIQGEFDEAARAIKPQADDQARPVTGVTVAPDADTTPPAADGSALVAADDALASAAAAADLGQTDPAQRAAQAASQDRAPHPDPALATPSVPAPPVTSAATQPAVPASAEPTAHASFTPPPPDAVMAPVAAGATAPAAPPPVPGTPKP